MRDAGYAMDINLLPEGASVGPENMNKAYVFPNQLQQGQEPPYRLSRQQVAALQGEIARGERQVMPVGMRLPVTQPNEIIMDGRGTGISIQAGLPVERAGYGEQVLPGTVVSRLRQEGLENVDNMRYARGGYNAAVNDASQTYGQRLRGEAPESSDIEVNRPVYYESQLGRPLSSDADLRQRAQALLARKAAENQGLEYQQVSDMRSRQRAADPMSIELARREEAQRQQAIEMEARKRQAQQRITDTEYWSSF